MRLQFKPLRANLFHTDKQKSKPVMRFLPHLEELERRETPNSLFNPLFGSAFLALDAMDVPYSIVPADGSTGGSSSSGDAGGGSTSGSGSTPPAWTDPGAADSIFASAISAIDFNASQFDSVLNTDNASFASLVAGNIGGQGQSAGTPAIGAAVVVGLPGLTNPPTSPTPSQDATAGPPPVLSPPAGTAGIVGQSLSPADFGLNPFTLRSGTTVSALTPFAVSAGMNVPAAQSHPSTTVNVGASATTTTTDSYSFAASLTTTADGGLAYQETYSFTFDEQTAPAATGGATVHDWGASGYTFVAANDGGQSTFKLTAALTSYETGSQTQATTNADGSANTATTTWRASTQYDRVIDDTTVQATGTATGHDSGGDVATQSSSTTGTYSRPIGVGMGSGTVSGTQTAYSGQGTSYQFSLQEGRDATGAITQSGTWANAKGGYSSDSYSGGGSYAAPSAAGGSPSTTPSATAAPSASGGPYADGAAVTGGGQYKESGADSMGYGYSDQYALQNDSSWQASSGAGGSSGAGYTQSSYSGSGGYGYGIAGGSVSGTWQESGDAETNYHTATTSTLGGSGWATTGNYASGDGGSQHDSYQGSGNYVIYSPASASGGSSGSGGGSGSSSGSGYGSGSGSGSASGGSGSGSGSSSGGVSAPASVLPSASGGLGAPGASFSGAGLVTESASDSSGYADNSGYTLASDGSWQSTSGSGATSASGFTQWGYAASGGYGYALVAGTVAGLWQQSGSASTSYDTVTNYTQSGSGAPTYTGSQNNGQSGGQHGSYSGSGNYAVSASGINGAALAGNGAATESGADDWGYGYATHSSASSDGSWQPATGSGATTETNSTHWGYSAFGGYGRPFDSGTLQGAWQASGGSATQFIVQSPSTLNPDGTWTTTGAASSSGSGSGAWSYSGSDAVSQSSSYGDPSNGGDSASSSHAAETYSQGWSSQYLVQSTLAANGSVTTVATASASGGASGNHAYSSSGNADSWSQTGDYNGGNGAASSWHGSSGVSLTESLQSQWQEGYTFTSLPGLATTMVGSASGSTQTSGDGSFYTTSLSQSASVGSYSSGFSNGYGAGWSSASDGQDHYSDQSSWSHGYAADGTRSSGYSSSNHVWGSLNSQWGNSSWWWSQGSGSGSSGSSSTGGSDSNGYDQTTYSPGFGGMTGVHDGVWTWGQGWYGAGISGPQGPTAYSGLGYIFTPTNPVAVADVADQSGTEGDSPHLQIQATDWSVGAASASGSGSGSGSGPYSASGLPAGLSINATGLISGTIQPGDAADGPYFVTVSYTDGAGHSASQSFLWNVADPVTFKDPGALFGAEGSFVSLAVPADDRIAGAPARTYSAVGLPGGLSIDSHTGVISGVLASGDAAAGPNDATVTATDGTYSGSQTFSWEVATAAPAGGGPLNTVADILAGSPAAIDAALASLDRVGQNIGSGLTLLGIGVVVAADDAPAPMKTKQQWLDVANGELHKWPETEVGDALTNNAKRSAFYAREFKDHPELKWLGMAAYASNGVGDAMWNASRGYGVKPFGAKLDNIFDLLAAGNREVFEDIAWQVAAYDGAGGAQGHGFDEIHAHKDDIAPTMYEGWMLIEKALKDAKDPDKAGMVYGENLDGNKLIAKHEQLEVLQPILDKNRDVAKKIGLLIATKTNFGFKGSKFDPFAYGDFGDPKLRWEWIQDGFIPGWVLWQAQEPKAAADFFEQVIKEGKDEK